MLDARHDGRGTGFFGEWVGGTRVIELDLKTLERVATYATHNGGNSSVAVDEERSRLFSSALGRHYVWETEALARRFHPGPKP
jgi:hypothetical protein